MGLDHVVEARGLPQLTFRWLTFTFIEAVGFFLWVIDPPGVIDAQK